MDRKQGWKTIAEPNMMKGEGGCRILASTKGIAAQFLQVSSDNESVSFVAHTVSV